jgi:kynurenine formamidase
MREVPDRRLKPWTPPTYTVDERGKLVGATPGPHHNWGRWGDDDQYGTTNLLTPECAVAGAQLVRRGARFALGLPIGGGFDAPSTRPPAIHTFFSSNADIIVGDAADYGLPMSDDVVVLPLQGSTQIDGLGHFVHNDVLYNGFWAGVVTASSGSRRLGVHHQARGIVGRGVLLDVAGVLGIDPFESPITPDMLDDCAQREGVTVRSGDILIVRTGYVGTWLAQPEVRKRRKQSGLTVATIPWLKEHDVAVVASDNSAVEAIGDQFLPPMSWHAAALGDLGLTVGELFDLDELAADCADDGVYEFFFTAAPLPIINAVGSPLNPIAIK